MPNISVMNNSKKEYDEKILSLLQLLYKRLVIIIYICIYLILIQ